MNFKEQLRAIQAAMQAIVDGAKAAGRDVTDAELATLEAKKDEALALKAKIERAEKADAIMERIGGMKSDVEFEGSEDPWLDTLAGGRKGYMSLAGAKGKELGSQFAKQIRETHGQKAFLTPGVVSTQVPLVDSSPLELGKIPTSILDLIATTQRATPTWRYMRQAGQTNNAAIVAPGATKPTSVNAIEEITGSLQVFAHLSEYVDEYLLADNTQLGNYLTGQLLIQLWQKVEEEVLNGPGTTGHLTGILNTSGIQTQAFATDKLTTLRTAALKLENLGYSTDAYVVNNADWAAIETARNSSGHFDLEGPIDRATQKIWGTQVVTSNRIAAGTALALDLSAVGLDTDTRGIQIKWDTSTGFDKNEVRARVEGRFGVSVFLPKAIVKATITGA
ncbi:phage major capsid protein [Microbacterium sp. 179-I 3D2 NHS]|uniref:phage major capsid protein n=1 Tax=Microbacterium sp. 179-I 3D2 NHS TaxID=3235178 RepID=UPI0039A35E05